MESSRTHGAISCRVGEASLSNVGWSLKSLRILFSLSLPSIRDVGDGVVLDRASRHKNSARFRWHFSCPIQLHFSIYHHRHVPFLAKELHHLLSRPRQLRPLGFRLRVLLKSANLAAVEHEVHLPQAALGSAPGRVAAAVQFDDRGVLDEGLMPDFDQGFFE